MQGYFGALAKTRVALILASILWAVSSVDAGSDALSRWRQAWARGGVEEGEKGEDTFKVRTDSRDESKQGVSTRATPSARARCGGSGDCATLECWRRAKTRGECVGQCSAGGGTCEDMGETASEHGDIEKEHEEKQTREEDTHKELKLGPWEEVFRQRQSLLVPALAFSSSTPTNDEDTGEAAPSNPNADSLHSYPSQESLSIGKQRLLLLRMNPYMGFANRFFALSSALLFALLSDRALVVCVRGREILCVFVFVCPVFVCVRVCVLIAFYNEGWHLGVCGETYTHTRTQTSQLMCVCAHVCMRTHTLTQTHTHPRMHTLNQMEWPVDSSVREAGHGEPYFMPCFQDLLRLTGVFVYVCVCLNAF